MNRMAAQMPEAWWHKPTALRAMGAAARGMLHTGRLGLAGHAPSGQSYLANPLVAWTIRASSATVEGRDVGPLGRLHEQDHLGDFWIPQRGLFVIGQAFFEPFDPARHHLEVHAEA